MKPQIDTIIMGFGTREEAILEAEKMVGDSVNIVGVTASRRLGEAVAYFPVPNGQRCPCCRAEIDLSRFPKDLIRFPKE